MEAWKWKIQRFISYFLNYANTNLRLSKVKNKSTLNISEYPKILRAAFHFNHQQPQNNSNKLELFIFQIFHAHTFSVPPYSFQIIKEAVFFRKHMYNDVIVVH